MTPVTIMVLLPRTGSPEKRENAHPCLRKSRGRLLWCPCDRTERFSHLCNKEHSINLWSDRNHGLERAFLSTDNQPRPGSNLPCSGISGSNPTAQSPSRSGRRHWTGACCHICGTRRHGPSDFSAGAAPPRPRCERISHCRARPFQQPH